MSGEIEAGREMDALVAEKVMGWVRVVDEPRLIGEWYRPPDYPMTAATCEVPRYSTEIGAAWSVVEKLESEGLLACVGRLPAGWTCCFADWERTTPKKIAPTAPLAICKAALSCLAALAAVGAQRGEK